MIAAFLGMRLYSVLGKRTGHEQEPVLPRREERTAPTPLRLDDADVAPAPRDAAADASNLVYEPAAEAGLRALLASDRHFDAGRFMEGAEAAYRMILEAYWAGDRATPRDLCDEHSHQAFADAIAAPGASGGRADKPHLGLNGAPAPRDAAADASNLVYEPAAEAGLRALLASDRHFDAGRFMEGAEAAYRMILEAYWAGDRDTLRDLCDDDSYQAFADAIAAREASGERLDNRLVGIDSTKIVAVEVGRSEARITVRYQADISAVTRDADGKVIAGSLSDEIGRAHV